MGGADRSFGTVPNFYIAIAITNLEGKLLYWDNMFLFLFHLNMLVPGTDRADINSQVSKLMTNWRNVARSANRAYKNPNAIINDKLEFIDGRVIERLSLPFDTHSDRLRMWIYIYKFHAILKDPGSIKEWDPTEITAVHRSSTWATPVIRTIQAAIEAFAHTIAHTILVCTLLLTMSFVQSLIHFLWRDEPRLILKDFPIEYVFDLSDLILLIIYLAYGIVGALLILWRKK